MKRISIIGLCLMAVVAMSAVGAASSSALPEFKSTNGFAVTFTSTSTLPLEPVLKSQILGKEENIDCKMSSDKGEVATSTTVTKVKVTYTECKEESAPTKACTTTGQAKGTIVTEEIRGKIGYVGNAAELVNKLVGIELRPTSTVFVIFTCEGKAEKVTVEGCTVGVATPTNVSTTSGFLAFEEIGGTNAKLQRFKGFADSGTGCTLNTHAGFFELGEGTSWLMDLEKETFTSPIEIKA